MFHLQTGKYVKEQHITVYSEYIFILCLKYLHPHSMQLFSMLMLPQVLIRRHPSTAPVES